MDKEAWDNLIKEVERLEAERDRDELLDDLKPILRAIRFAWLTTNLNNIQWNHDSRFVIVFVRDMWVFQLIVQKDGHDFVTFETTL